MNTRKLLMLLLSIAMFSACQSDDDNGPRNNAPVLNDVTLDVSENPNSDLVTTIIATDLDEDQLTYSITSQTPANSVTINQSNGEVYIANASAFDYDQNQQIVVNIMVTDGTDETTAILTINITEDA